MSFRRGKTNTLHILALRRLIEKVKTHNHKAIITYIIFLKKEREMMTILKVHNVPPRLPRAISKIYGNTRARVITPDGESEQRSRRNPATTITNLDFADDVALLRGETEQVQDVLRHLKNEAEKVGLYYNTKQAEIKIFNHELLVDAKENGQSLKIVDYFKYFGVWTENTSKYFAVRKALTWNECHK